MPLRDIMLVLIVVVAFGSNFTAMKFVLAEIPPYLFTALRTTIVLPILFFLPKPDVSWIRLIALGAFIHVGQFGFLFSALNEDATAGLGSLLIQAQVPFTMLLAALLFGERMRLLQALGVGVALSGLGIFAVSAGGNLTLHGLGLILLGALSWALGNLLLRKTPSAHPMTLPLWAGVVPVIPMTLLSILFENPAPIALLSEVSLQGWISAAYVSMASVIVGYTLWSLLLSRHPAADVTPFALLVPVVGIVTAAMILGETLTAIELVGTVTVFAGLTLAVLGPRWQDRSHG